MRALFSSGLRRIETPIDNGAQIPHAKNRRMPWTAHALRKGCAVDKKIRLLDPLTPLIPIPPFEPEGLFPADTDTGADVGEGVCVGALVGLGEPVG